MTLFKSSSSYTGRGILRMTYNSEYLGRVILLPALGKFHLFFTDAYMSSYTKLGLRNRYAATFFVHPIPYG